MSDPARAGEAGYWARRVQWTRDIRLLSGYVKPRPHRKTAAELDPARRPETHDEAAQRRIWTEDETPGLDEAHCLPGHPLYRPGGTP